MNRLGDVLQRLQPEIVKAAIELAGDLVVDTARHIDRTRLGQAFQPRSDIDAVAVKVAALDDDVAEIDPMRSTIWRAFGKAAFASAMRRCSSMAAVTALTALANSMSTPSPMTFAMRP